MNASGLIDAMRQCLREGEILMSQLDEESYVRRSPQVLDASVGGHYRHLLDHFRNLLEMDADRHLDYDRRNRNSLVETDRDSALAETRRLAALIEDLGPEWAQQTVQISSRVKYDDSPPSAVHSTAGREAVFCVLHAVHHYALIRVICGLSGKSLPDTFGFAPSTVAATASCLQSAGTGGS